MNKMHNIIWSSVLNTWVVVSELVSLHKKSSTASSNKFNQMASATLHSHPLKPVNIPNLSLLALSLCAVLSLTGAPSAFAGDITAGGGKGGDNKAIDKGRGGLGGIAGGGGGSGGNGTAGSGGNGATLNEDAQSGMQVIGGGLGGGIASGEPDLSFGGGGGGAGNVLYGNGGTGGRGLVSDTLTSNAGTITGGDGEDSPGSGGGGGGGGGGGLVLTGSAVNFQNTGTIAGGQGGDQTDVRFASGGGGGGAGLVLMHEGTITNQGVVTGGNGGADYLSYSGSGGAGLFLFDGGSLVNEINGQITGGASGTVLNSGKYGNGGSAVLSNRGTIENSGSITGGATQDAGIGGDGVTANGGTILNKSGANIVGGANKGSGVSLINDGDATLTNQGTITGGSAGGVGVNVASNNNKVINAGTISGTSSGNAVTLSGNNNTLQLEENYSFTGNVVSTGTGNILALGGQTDASFDVAKISATGQFRGFSGYQKLDDSTWTLTGTASLATDWDIQAGTLHLKDAGALNGGSVDLSGGILSAGSGTFTGTVNLKQDDGTINIIEDETADFSGDITGDANLIKTGAGTLLLSSVKSYTGDTLIDGGELKAGVADALVNSSALIINQGSTFTLNNLAQTVNNLSGAGNISLGTATLTTNNTTDSVFSGAITGTGGLTKTGANTLTLAGQDYSLGAIDVQKGTLELEQKGVLTTTNYLTQTAATTYFSGLTSQLHAQTFEQQEGSFLKINVGEDWSEPVISADQVTLGGTLIFNGFSERDHPVSASQARKLSYRLIESQQEITTDFDDRATSLVPTGLDYLLHNGHLSDDKLSYNLGFHLAWTTDKNESATGNFTLNADTAFNIDIALNDRVVPVGGFASNWDGKSLLKDGEGRLILSKQNGYTGLTTVQGGILEFGTDNSIASSSDVIVHNSLVDLKGYAQQFNRLSGDGGTINIDGTTLTAHNATTADSTLYSGALTGNGAFVKTGLGRLTLSGDTLWTGDTELREGELLLDGVNGGAQLTSNIIGQQGTQFKLLNGASLIGWIDPTDVEIDSSSGWNMTASSLLDNLTNDGMISFAESTTGDFKTLTVNGNYQGDNGLLLLNTQLGKDNSLTDKLVIQGDTSGTTNVLVNNAGGSGAETLNGIEVITVGGQSDGEFVQSGRITAGAYDYTLERGANNTKNWYLTNFSSSDTPTERPEAGAYGANLAAANTLFLTSLHDRVEQTPYLDVLTGERKTTSLWLRNEGSHNRFRDESGQLKTQANRYVLQLGGDITLLTHTGSDLFTLGGMVGYGNSSSSTVSQSSGYRAKGKVDGYNVGVYGTWFANGADQLGLYVDSWVQYSWFNNTVSGEDLNSEQYKSSGVTTSIESGYTFKVAENAAGNTHFFIQPKAQVTWMGVTAKDHQEANGSNIKGEGDGNTQTRLGVKGYFTTNKEQVTGSNLVLNPFAEINWIHNTRQFGANMDGISLKQSGASHIGELKLGVEGQVNQQFDLWGNIAQQIGDKGYSNTSAMLGVKYHF